MQYKTLIDTSYTTIQMEFEDHLLAGWRVNRDNLPAAYPMRFYEIHLVLDEHAEDVKDVFDESITITGGVLAGGMSETPKKQAGRPPKVKA